MIELVRSSLQEVGVDPQTGKFDADVVETDDTKADRDLRDEFKALIQDIENNRSDGAPIEVVEERVEETGLNPSHVDAVIEMLKQMGEVYEPKTDHLRTT